MSIYLFLERRELDCEKKIIVIDKHVKITLIDILIPLNNPLQTH